MTTTSEPTRDRLVGVPPQLVLSAWSAVSPFGVGRTAWSDAVLAATPPAAPPGARTVPDFSAAGQLGRKGTRTMDRLTALAVTAVSGLVEECGPQLTEDAERVGLVIGTGWASLQGIMDTTRESVTGVRPYDVDPAKFPNTVMNKAAAQSAIWHRVRGPNTTVSGDWLSALLALSYAVRLYRAGHCDRVLCGAAEEYSAQRETLERLAGGDEELGEGSVAFLLESFEQVVQAGRTPLVSVLATRFRAYGEPAAAGAALATCVRDALAQTGTDVTAVRLVATSGVHGELGRSEETAVAGVLGTVPARRVLCRPLTGDTTAVSTAFQIASILAVVRQQPLQPGEVALVTAVGRDGSTGCAVLGGCRTVP